MAPEDLRRGGRADDFFMRSLRADIGAVEAPLSEVQEVSLELVATAGDCSFSFAGTLSACEVFLTPLRRMKFVTTVFEDQ